MTQGIKYITAIALQIILSGIIYGQNVPSYVSTNGLAGWWPFTGNADDSSGNGNNGTVYGAALATDRFGNIASSFNYDGIDDRIEVADQPMLNCRKITLSVWVFPYPFLQGVQIIYKADLNTAANETYSINSVHAAIKGASLCVAGAGWHILSLNQALPSAAWHHIVVTYDGDTLKNYVNGVLKNTLFYQGLIDSCPGGNLRFGFNHLNNNNGNPFKGKIDDIGIWNRALSQQEITALYNSGSVGLEENYTSKDILLFPNPISDELNISTSIAFQAQINIFDITSRKILQQTFYNSVTISTTTLLKGIYFYEVKLNDGKTLSGKLVKH